MSGYIDKIPGHYVSLVRGQEELRLCVQRIINSKQNKVNKACAPCVKKTEMFSLPSAKSMAPAWEHDKTSLT